MKKNLRILDQDDIVDNSPLKIPLLPSLAEVCQACGQGVLMDSAGVEQILIHPQ